MSDPPYSSGLAPCGLFVSTTEKGSLGTNIRPGRLWFQLYFDVSSKYKNSHENAKYATETPYFELNKHGPEPLFLESLFFFAVLQNSAWPMG